MGVCNLLSATQCDNLNGIASKPTYNKAYRGSASILSPLRVIKFAAFALIPAAFISSLTELLAADRTDFEGFGGSMVLWSVGKDSERTQGC